MANTVGSARPVWANGGKLGTPYSIAFTIDTTNAAIAIMPAVTGVAYAVLGFAWYSSGDSNTAQWLSGSTAMDYAQTMNAGNGRVEPSGSFPWFITTAGQALNIAAVISSGVINGHVIIQNQL